MRHMMLAIALVVGLLSGPAVVPAGAVTIEEVFSLRANGLSDDILVALIESDGSVFHLLPEDVVELYRRGLSERVILAMIRTRRPDAQAPVDDVNVPQQTTTVAPVQIVESPVEVYVPVAVPVNVYVPVKPRHEKPEARPSSEYWGFGGRLRPDAWGQPRRAEPENGREPERRREPERTHSDRSREPAPRRR